SRRSPDATGSGWTFLRRPAVARRPTLNEPKGRAFAHPPRKTTSGRSSTMLNQTARQILTINTGSSSLKVALYEAGRDETRILSGEVERICVPGGRFRLTDAHGATLIDRGGDLPDHGAALGVALAGLRHFRPELDLDAVGHRVVHGGIH